MLAFFPAPNSEILIRDTQTFRVAHAEPDYGYRNMTTTSWDSIVASIVYIWM